MNWLTDKVLPKIRALGRKQETPENLWTKCPACNQMVFNRELETNHQVCPRCNHHLRIGPTERFAMLFDEGRFQRIELPEPLQDPLRFRDTKKYADRLKAARLKTTQKDAMSLAYGAVGGHATVVAVQNFAFMGGSLGMAAGDALIAAAKLASLQSAALVVFAAAGGARMQEGILSLMQLPRTVVAVQRLREAGLPYICVLTDPTTGGVTASYAMLGDISIAEPGALIGFAGPRVIEQTIRETLPRGFQRAEYLLEHGMLDMVVPRAQLRATLVRLIDLLRRPAESPQALPPPRSQQSGVPVRHDPAASSAPAK
jgi:acetyl-CoA carboxylase carboxyl transferase subunit beta